MRARHSAAIMRRMNIDELMADSISGFVETPQRLANEKAHYLRIKAMIANTKSPLFKDHQCSQAFNKKLLELFPDSVRLRICL